MIPQIQNSSGEVVTSFYSQHYSSEQPKVPLHGILSALGLTFTKYPLNIKNTLEAPFQMAEITEAIKSLQSDKSPGQMASQMNFSRNS